MKLKERFKKGQVILMANSVLPEGVERYRIRKVAIRYLYITSVEFSDSIYTYVNPDESKIYRGLAPDQ